jgi:valyl-tRNA synthetase
MSIELPKQYDPHEAQKRWLQFWEEQSYFHSRPEMRGEKFTIVIPPPNVTGGLHMGHAVNNIPQDVLCRWRRMQGYNVLWMPGTDHAAIATQAVVERRLREEEGKTRHDLGPTEQACRDELVRRINRWTEEYGSRILNQLRELGCSCDWQRTRFTLDPICTRAVRHTFFAMFKDGYIYRGKRLVNWDTQLQTSVADDETYDETIKGGFWTFRYPVKGADEFVHFSTTRPETMLGDTAVAVHPGDERYRHLVGKTAIVPLVAREIPIIADGILVDPSLGTGCVKVTPAHDRFDYECGLRHQLPMINILNPDGTINSNGGAYAGLDRYQARQRVTEDMDKLGLFGGCEEREIPLKYSDRSKTPIEPYLSDQWFVRMGMQPFDTSCQGKPGLAQLAIDAVISERVRFFPERYAKMYLDWLAAKRDWCISRQLWYGHQIPVWVQSCADEAALNTLQNSLKQHPSFVQGKLPYQIQLDEERKAARFRGVREQDLATVNRPYASIQVCLLEDEPGLVRGLEQMGFARDPDVLDTWFSSALWPHSTLGWPGPAFPDQPPGPQNPDWQRMRDYYPTSVLVTNRDIITLWVARMVITGLYNVGEIPFHHVYIHPTLLDAFGGRMSKSKGNGVDPLDIIERYGCDALRFQVVHSTTETDSRMPVANVCPNCEALVPVKQEHMYMRTRKVTCPSCKKPFRPGGPWPAEDLELPTAKQASERYEMGRNFANKLWNAARFLLLNLEGYAPRALTIEELPIEDRWILSRLATTATAMTEQLSQYHFGEAARAIYEFTWSEFCDWYLEMSKGRLRDDAQRPGVQRVLAGVLDGILRLVQPIMPFVAESIWQALSGAAFERGLPNPEPASPSVVIAPWPVYPAAWIDPVMEKRIARMQELVSSVREVRNRYTLDPRVGLDVFVRCQVSTADDLRLLAPFVKLLAGVGRLECGPEIVRPLQTGSQVHPEFEAYISLAGLIDVAAERQRFEKQLAEKRKHLQSVRAKLDSAAFLGKAPAEVVQQQRDQASELENQIRALEENLRALAEPEA